MIINWYCGPCFIFMFWYFFFLTEYSEGKRDLFFFILKEIIFNYTKNARHSETLKVTIYLFSINVKK